MPQSSNGNVLTLTLGSPSLSNSSQPSAISPRIAAGSLPMSPSTSQQSTPSMAKRSLSIKRKPVPAYLDNDISLNGHSPHEGHKGAYVLSVDQPIGDEEVLKSPVLVGSEHAHEDGVSPPTPFNGFVRNSPHLSISSTLSSPVLPTRQSQDEGTRLAGGQPLAANPIILNAVVSPGNEQSKEPVMDQMRRESEASMSSSISSGNSDFAQPIGSRPPSAARNTLLGRSLYNLNNPEANNLSTNQLFTIPPQEDSRTNSRLSMLHPGSSERSSPRALERRTSADKPLKRQVSALRSTHSDGAAEESRGHPEVLAGLGIRGADLTPTETLEERSQSRHESSDDSGHIRITQSRLNRSLPSLPVNRTQSNLASVAMTREKGIFRRKQVKVDQDFSESAVPTPMRLWEASQCHLVDETGRKRRFGDFWDTYAVQHEEDSDKASARKPGVRSSASNLVVHQHHRQTHASHLTDSRPSVEGAPGIVREKAESAHSGRHAVEPKIGGEEYIIQGRRTAVFWIRHFWCGQCTSYNRSLIMPLTVHYRSRLYPCLSGSFRRRSDPQSRS